MKQLSYERFCGLVFFKDMGIEILCFEMLSESWSNVLNCKTNKKVTALMGGILLKPVIAV